MLSLNALNDHILSIEPLPLPLKENHKYAITFCSHLLPENFFNFIPPRN